MTNVISLVLLGVLAVLSAFAALTPGVHFRVGWGLISLIALTGILLSFPPLSAP